MWQGSCHSLEKQEVRKTIRSENEKRIDHNDETHVNLRLILPHKISICKVTPKRVRVTIVAVKKQSALYSLTLCF